MKLSCRDRSDQVQFMKKISQDNDVTNRIGVVYVKKKLGCRHKSDRVRTVTKTSQDNEMSNHTNTI